MDIYQLGEFGLIEEIKKKLEAAGAKVELK